MTKTEISNIARQEVRQMLDTDDTLAGDSDYKIPTQKATKAFVEANVASGASGSFTAQSGEEITVVNGLITAITAP